MVLRILAPLEGVLILLTIQGMYYSALSSVPSFQTFSFHTFLIQQAEVTLLKSAGEAFSYAYFKAVEGAFDPNKYSDEPSERWDVPTWFVDPPGGSVQECNSGLGCTVWNLSGGPDLNDPCPNVVSYTPNPAPNLYPSVSTSSVKTYFNQLRDSLADQLQERGVDTSATLTTSIAGSYTMNAGLSYSGSVGYLRKNESRSFTWTFSPMEWNQTEIAYCECNYGSGYQRVATYTLKVVRFGLTGDVEGHTLLREDSSIPYLKYFSSVSKNYPSGTPKSCRMVVP